MDIPNGSLLNQYRLKGVIKVVRGREDLARGTRQNPLFASNFENSFAPEKAGLGCHQCVALGVFHGGHSHLRA